MTQQHLCHATHWGETLPWKRTQVPARLGFVEDHSTDTSAFTVRSSSAPGALIVTFPRRHVRNLALRIDMALGTNTVIGPRPPSTIPLEIFQTWGNRGNRVARQLVSLVISRHITLKRNDFTHLRIELVWQQRTSPNSILSLGISLDHEATDGLFAAVKAAVETSRAWEREPLAYKLQREAQGVHHA